MSPLQVAVIGGGRLGGIHARLLPAVAGASLLAIVEPQREAHRRLAEEHRVPVHDSLEPLWGRMDAAIVAAPTSLHETLGLELIERGVHVLMEKPLADRAPAARELCEAARRRRVVLQVGHVERFNPALQTVREFLQRPQFLHAERTSGFYLRSIDVGVVLDLMIHDLDIILSLHGGEVTGLHAVGAAVIGPHEDWAHAQLQFDDGAAACLTASRVDASPRRLLRVATPDAWVELDYARPSARVTLPHKDLLAGRWRVDRLGPEQLAQLQAQLTTDFLPTSEPHLPTTNAIQEEQRDFVACIRESRAPRVSGRDGWRALELAERILRAIREQSVPTLLSPPAGTPWPLRRAS